MFDEIVNRILEGHNVFPLAKAPMASGPNVISPGPTPTGFMGGGIPGIGSGKTAQIVLKSKKKKRRKITK